MNPPLITQGEEAGERAGDDVGEQPREVHGLLHAPFLRPLCRRGDLHELNCVRRNVFIFGAEGDGSSGRLSGRRGDGDKQKASAAQLLL